MIRINDFPEIEGVRFRTFAGEDDYPKMAAIFNEAAIADKLDQYLQVSDIRHGYTHLKNSNPETDMIFAEVNGKTVAYARIGWFQEEKTNHRIYYFLTKIMPECRFIGIERAIAEWCETRSREIAADHPKDGKRFFQTNSNKLYLKLNELLKSLGYQPIRYEFRMSRLLEDIPEAELPQGIEIKPVRIEDTKKIWEASIEAFRDHWGFSEPHEEAFESFKTSKFFQPELWQVAWDDDEVVGSVMNYINHSENEKYNRKIGWTEKISIRRAWRRHGIARALILRSMQMHKALGMTRVALDVDSENPNGALQLYKSLGYQEEKTFISFRKEMN